MSVTNSKFLGNTATQNGGVLSLLGNYNYVTMRHLNMTSNSALNFGGAIYYAASSSTTTMTIDDVIISGSYAPQVSKK